MLDGGKQNDVLLSVHNNGPLDGTTARTVDIALMCIFVKAMSTVLLATEACLQDIVALYTSYQRCKTCFRDVECGCEMIVDVYRLMMQLEQEGTYMIRPSVDNSSKVTAISLMTISCSRRVTTMWVNRPLQISQLSLPSFRGR